MHFVCVCPFLSRSHALMDSPTVALSTAVSCKPQLKGPGMNCRMGRINFSLSLASSFRFSMASSPPIAPQPSPLPLPSPPLPSCLQIFNQVNSRKLHEWNVFAGILSNPLFVSIIAIELGVQVRVWRAGRQAGWLAGWLAGKQGS